MQQLLESSTRIKKYAQASSVCNSHHSTPNTQSQTASNLMRDSICVYVQAFRLIVSTNPLVASELLALCISQTGSNVKHDARIAAMKRKRAIWQNSNTNMSHSNSNNNKHVCNCLHARSSSPHTQHTLSEADTVVVKLFLYMLM